MSQIWLRSSLLDEDCDRRLAVKQWRKMFINDGHDLRETGNHIGAAAGTVNHAVFAAQLLFKRDVGHAPMNWRHGLEEALAKLDEDVKEKGLNPDKTTGSRAELVEQVEAVVRLFHYGMLPYLRPKRVEEELSLWWYSDQSLMLTATGDLFTQDGGIIDFKTGAREPIAPLQIGAQAWLLEEHGETVRDGALIWFPRKGNKEAVPVPYKIKECKDEVKYRVAQLERDFRNYKKERTPLVFRANPKSTSCDKRYCPAYSTSACPLMQGERDADV